MEETRWKRPWLAALLGALVTGLGHLYLRRWWRALGWLFVTAVTSILFVPSSALTTLQSQLLNPGSASIPFGDLLPLLAIGVCSVLDAYVIARTNNQMMVEQQLGIQRCRECGRKIDPEVPFCQWCGTSQEDQHEVESELDQESTEELDEYGFRK